MANDFEIVFSKDEEELIRNNPNNFSLEEVEIAYKKQKKDENDTGLIIVKLSILLGLILSVVWNRELDSWPF